MKPLFILLIVFGTGSQVLAQNVGIGTETPQAMLDINGDVVFRTSELPVTDSVTIALDVNQSKFSSYRITQADSAFIIAGITAGADGRLLVLINQTGQAMTLTHEDPLADPANQIMTSDHAPVVLQDMGTVDMQYDSIVQKWIVHTTNQVTSETIWDTTGNNIFFENYVGIGTESPTAPLSIETALDEVGFSHMAGEDSITVASSVTALSGAVGTESDHIFSLNAGGAGKVHIWPDGDVVIGEESAVQGLVAAQQSRMNVFDSKLTVLTPLLETGYTHIGGDNEIIFNQAIGGVSASIGTMSNHTFRIKTNGTGKLNIYPDGRMWIGPESAGANAPLTIWGSNNDYGLTLLGESDQMFGIRMGGFAGSVGIGTYTPHNLRMVCNGQNAINVAATSLNVGIGIDFAGEKLSVFTPENSYGISHSTSGGIKLATHIGQVSASFGTVTNNRLRFLTNNNIVMTLSPAGNVGIGIDEPTNKFEVNGTMRSKEIIVELNNWPDYVFENEYPLRSLADLEMFIHENGHLPAIPPAHEIHDNGLAMGEMQKNMMEKIEELTLYIIQLHKRIAALEQGAKQ